MADRPVSGAGRALLVIALLALSLCGQSASPSEVRLTREVFFADVPAVLVEGARYGDLVLEFHDAEGKRLENWSASAVTVRGLEKLDGTALEGLEVDAGRLALPAARRTAAELAVLLPGAEPLPLEVRSVSGFWSILPPALAILLAVLTRQVLVALFLGVLGGVVVMEGGVVSAFFATVDRHVVHALADPSHLKILVFSSLLGAVVALVTKMGGMRALVEALTRRIRTRRGIQVGTWFMGAIVFFDDYANALLVGNTVRPASDRFRVSREKLAYLVDATAAPVACIAVISTWIVAEVGFVDEWLQSEMARADGPVAGFDNAYAMFLESIPYNFYPILALVFGLSIALSGRDFGPMLDAERRALSTGALLRPGATAMAGDEMEQMDELPPGRCRIWNGVLPLATVILGVVFGLYWSGIGAVEDPETLGFFERVRLAYGQADSYDVLIGATLVGLVLAWGLGVSQRLLTLTSATHATIQGMKAMLTALLVLTFAWTLSDVCGILNTSGWLIEVVDMRFDVLPVVVFFLAAVVGFSTGSSWGTMGILIPLTLAFAVEAGVAAGADQELLSRVLLASLGAVLAGAVFGDHCSPISDTTVMSSMASGSDHLDHVRTQLPYALLVALVAALCGYLPAGYGVPPWIGLAVGSVLCVVLVRVLGRPAEGDGASPVEVGEPGRPKAEG